MTNTVSVLRAGLGPLELRVLEALWAGDRAATVRDVQFAFPDLAYTTLLTTLDRLYRKGILLRQRHGRAFAYQPRCSPEAFFSEMVSDQLYDLLGAVRIRSAILSTLLHTVGRINVGLLDELGALVPQDSGGWEWKRNELLPRAAACHARRVWTRQLAPLDPSRAGVSRSSAPSKIERERTSAHPPAAARWGIPARSDGSLTGLPDPRARQRT